MLAADDKLFIVTAEGSILAFAAPAAGEATKHVATDAPPPAADEWTEQAAAILEATGVRDGYALVLGIDSGRLVEELVRQSSLHVIAVDDDADKVAALRERLYLAGLYGTRASVLVGNPVTYPFPPYLASLVVSETPDDLEQAEQRALAKAVFHTLRPYGGVACAWGSLADRSRIEEIVKARAFPGAKRSAGWRLRAAGPLRSAAGSGGLVARGSRRGQHRGVGRRTSLAHCRCCGSMRRSVGTSTRGRTRFAWSAGRLVLLEQGLLRASDVYTGRKLWEAELSDEPLDRQGIRYTRHRQWGPSPSLSPTTELVVVEDAIYLGDGTSCLVFDPATGKPTGRIALPEDLEIALGEPPRLRRLSGGQQRPHVLCVNRRTGKLLWRVEAARAVAVPCRGRRQGVLRRTGRPTARRR